MQNEKQLQVVIVPRWIEEALEAAGGSRKLLLDPVALTGILSKADVAFYFLLNTEADFIYPKYLNESLRRFDLFNFMSFNGTDNPEKQNWRDDFFDVLHKVRREHQDLTMVDLQGSLASLDDKFTKSVYKNVDNYVYELTPIDGNVLGLTFKPMTIIDDEPANDIDIVQTRLNCIDRTIKQMLAYLSFEDVVLTPIFKEFTRLAKFGISL